MDNQLYIKVLGKMFLITAMFDNDIAANEYMEQNPGEGVIAVEDDMVLIARNDDEGIPI